MLAHPAGHSTKLTPRRVLTIGHSLGITLPPEWLRLAECLPGDVLAVKLSPKARTLTLRKLANGPRHSNSLHRH